ncbi:MAG: hypothetical protein CME45_03775, partial [Halieaceae bacterium]|nr:hypothetical protein [Halieaceae bacterium]
MISKKLILLAVFLTIVIVIIFAVLPFPQGNKTNDDLSSSQTLKSDQVQVVDKNYQTSVSSEQADNLQTELLFARRNQDPKETTGIISTTLATMLDRMNSGQISSVQDLASVRLHIDDADRVQVYIELFDSSSAQISELRALGLEVELINDNLKMVQGWIFYENISELASLGNVSQIKLPNYAMSNRGSRMTEGDRLLLADKLRSMGYSGKGVKIGIISDGGNDIADAIATNDLPNDVKRFGSCSERSANRSQCRPQWTCNEGTAIAEIVHDIAPDASLAIGAVGTSLEFIERVNDLSTRFDADVIVDDLGFFNEPFFADGAIANAVSNVADEIVYVSAAGNSADTHYEAEFKALSYLGGNLHNFSNSSASDPAMDIEILPDGYVVAILQWNDRFGSSSNDYDIGLVDFSETQILASSEDLQAGSHDPIEAFCYHNNSSSAQRVKLAVELYAG